jgi:hypothetical protein
MAVPAKRTTDDPIVKEAAWSGNTYVSVRDVCTATGLNFLTEAERIRTSSFAAGKFRDVTNPREMWVDVSVISSWLNMAPIEPGSEFDAAKQQILAKYNTDEPNGFQLEDTQDLEKVLLAGVELVRQKKQLQIELEATKQKAIEFKGKADLLDKVVECKEGETCIRDTYKALNIEKIYKTEQEFIDRFLWKQIKWCYRRVYQDGKRGRPIPEATAIHRGFVKERKAASPYSEARVFPQCVITQKGFVWLKEYFSSKSNHQLFEA